MNPTTTIGVVAHYNLLEALEPAGPGDLYRARDTKHGRTVIVRVIPPVSPEEERALLRQIQSLTSLSHQNVIHIYQSGVQDGRVYLAFEHVTGRALRGEMAGRPMNTRRAVEAAIAVTDAIAEAHALGFLHSGISPDTIALSVKGHVKVAAFHLGTALGFEARGDEVRLADYESPEEARSESADERSDVYSIGAVLYEMLTARKPMHRGASAPSTSNPIVPKELDAVVLRAVAPNPERRYQSAAELARSLRQVLPGLQLPDVPPDVVGAPGATLGRVVVLSVVILAVLAVCVWWFTRS